MNVKLLYGKTCLEVPFPDQKTAVILPHPVSPVTDEANAIREALRDPIGSAPLAQIATPDDTVAIVFSDITRAMPSDRVLPVLLDELSHVPDDQIVLINALGTHRANTGEELVHILGKDVSRRYRIVQHDCHSKEGMLNLGKTSLGHDAWVNRVYMESSVRILTGFIEPHLFAGFSGGPKSVLPGIAGYDTIVANHAADMIGHPNATFTHTHGNPIWEEMFEVASMTRPQFILNVTLSDDHRITGVFAGELGSAHKSGVDFVRKTAMVAVDRPYDIVVTTAGGYPMDISMYQSVKGIVAAAGIVREGGTIILASECAEGLPDFGEYGSIMRMVKSPDELLDLIHQPGFHMQDQWDAQIQAQICKHKKVFIYSSGLTNEEICQVLAEPCHDIGAFVLELLESYGPDARIAVLPVGPITVPYIRTP